MKQYIKVANPAIVEQLSNAGFSYMREKVNGIDLAVFAASPELLGFLDGKFNSEEFIYSNKLHF